MPLRRRRGPAAAGCSSTTAWTSRASRASAPASTSVRGTCRRRPRGRSCRRARRSESRPHDPEAAARAFAFEAADYVAFGPVFESPTKRVRSARGLDALGARGGGQDQTPRRHRRDHARPARRRVGRGSGRRRDDRRAVCGWPHRRERARGPRRRAPPPPAAADLSRRIHGERQVLGRTAGGRAPRPPVRRRRHRDRAHLGTHDPRDLRGVRGRPPSGSGRRSSWRGSRRFPASWWRPEAAPSPRREPAGRSPGSERRSCSTFPSKRSAGGFRARPTGPCFRASSSSRRCSPSARPSVEWRTSASPWAARRRSRRRPTGC